MITMVIVLSIGAVGVLNAVLFWFLPGLTRPDLYFAVTVPPGFRDDPRGRTILRRYRVELILLCALAVAALVGGVFWLGVGFVPGGYFLQLAASLLAFYRARQRVLPHALAPTTVREADLHGPPRIIPGGWVVACGPFILLVACAGYLWATRGHAVVFFLATVAILAAFSLMLYGLGHWVRPVHAGGPEGARELKFRRTVAAVALAVQYFLAAQSSWIALVHGHEFKAGKPGALTLGLMPLVPVLVLVVVVVLARLGQGGAKGPSTAAGVPVGDRTPDKYWKLGLFYFNPEDSAVFIEKRFGLGYTFNFARPVTWIIMGLLLMSALVQVVAARLRL